MAKQQEPQQPLILRAHRLMDAFAKSDDERDFYLDRSEGFLIYVDLDKPQPELEALEKELEKNPEKYCMIPKLTFYETKKFMEGFVTEKIYDIDTKEKLLDIIQSKEARTNFLEFIYDHHAEQEKWQQYYQERSRIRIIEWLRQNRFNFVFEEDLELTRNMLEKLKQSIFKPTVSGDVQTSRKLLLIKAKSYYSNEALNPRPKRGRPPKQIAKLEIEPQVSSDIYLNVSAAVRPFLFIPEFANGTVSTFASEFTHHPRRQLAASDLDPGGTFQQKMESLKRLASRWAPQQMAVLEEEEYDDILDKDEEFEEEEEAETNRLTRKRNNPSSSSKKAVKGKKTPKKMSTVTNKKKSSASTKKSPSQKAAKKPLRAMTRIQLKDSAVFKKNTQKDSKIKKGRS